jgi:hypothetical protein
LFPKGNHSLSTAYRIDGVDKSWVAYASIEQPDRADYYQFPRGGGQRIDLSLFSAGSPAVTGFRPSLALLVPGLDRRDSMPGFVEIPKNYGSIVVKGIDPGKATYEPFAQGMFYVLGKLSLDAPTEGTYYVVVFSPTKGVGNYGLPIGYLESWTPFELALLPFNCRRIYAWEGQNQFLTLLPLILTLVLGGLLLGRRSRLGRAPLGSSQWLAAFAGLFFIGTALNAVAKMLWSFAAARITEEALITLLVVAVPTLLGTLALIYATRGGTLLTCWIRILLISIGIVGLFSWCGLYFGPAMAIAAGSVAPFQRTAKNGRNGPAGFQLRS